MRDRIASLFLVTLLFALPLSGCGQDKTERGLTTEPDVAAPPPDAGTVVVVDEEDEEETE